MHTTSRIGRMTALAALALAAACGGADDAATDDTLGSPTIGAGADTAGAMGAAGAMSDTAIIGQMSGANGGEIAAGQIAADKARNADVRQFAQTMVTDHQRMQGQVDSLVASANIAMAPVPDSLSEHLEHARQQLTGQAAGADFDRMYMDMQVTDHQNTLNALNAARTATQNAQLRTLIEGAIPAVQQHLDRARQIRTSLGG